MSAGAPVEDRDTLKLAPQFRLAVEAALLDCAATGLDAYVFEAMRSEELQAFYYTRGRTLIPPEKPVTNARSALYSWHGFGLAVDVVSRAHGWDRPWTWWVAVAAHFSRQGCRWGGEWRNPDPPHHQWGLCKPSPSHRARELLASGGLPAVWAAVRANVP
ncbi:MAG TPA: M15 family metallopeptidase [Gemmatimonadales bacterium]|nr:M15 family metallopeptidase [Gemmatimonadales bacterium]